MLVTHPCLTPRHFPPTEADMSRGSTTRCPEAMSHRLPLMPCPLPYHRQSRQRGCLVPVLKYRHDTQVLSKVVVSKIAVSKIVETPLTVRRRLVCFRDDESERTWGTMLAPYCVYIFVPIPRISSTLAPHITAQSISTTESQQTSSGV